MKKPTKKQAVKPVAPETRECPQCFRNVRVEPSGGLAPHSVSPLINVPCAPQPTH